MIFKIVTYSLIGIVIMNAHSSFSMHGQPWAKYHSHMANNPTDPYLPGNPAAYTETTPVQNEESKESFGTTFASATLIVVSKQNNFLSPQQ